MPLRFQDLLRLDVATPVILAAAGPETHDPLCKCSSVSLVRARDYFFPSFFK